MMDTSAYTRVSKYYPGCDGTLLAVDIYRPRTVEPIPVLFHCGYAPRRQSFQQNEAAILRFLGANYAVAVVEPRGCGVSHGVSEGFFGPKDGRDMAALIDAITLEPWCNGRAGSFGGSNSGLIQQLTLAEAPARYFAAVPCDCNANFYYQNYTNGASTLPRRPRMPADPQAPLVLGDPVDEDPAPDFPMAREAALCQRQNMGFLEQYIPNMYRDQVNPRIGYAPNLEIPVWERMDVVRHGHTAVYQNAAWFDPGCTGEILSYKSWGGKLLLGPWRHCELYSGGSDLPEGRFDWVAEHLRFFDAVLKDKENGALAEPPIYYYTMGDEPGQAWHYAGDLPLDSQTQPEFYLAGDGTLTAALPPATSVAYTVREDGKLFPGFGKMSRRIETDLSGEDAKCVCFDSAPLETDIELTGVPVLELYVSSTYPDGNFIAALEAVTPDGFSHYITDGAARASHAKTSPNSAWDSLGLPYHRGYLADKTELHPERPLPLSFNLEATSYVVKKGAKLRIAIHCGGSGYSQPEGFPAELPTVRFHLGGDTPALLRLPVIAPNVTAFPGVLTIDGADEPATLHAFKQALYLQRAGRSWQRFPCVQVYPDGARLIFVTEGFRAVRETRDGHMHIAVEGENFAFAGSGKLPARGLLHETSNIQKKQIPPFLRARLLTPSHPNLYVATVPVRKEQPGQGNPQPVQTLDLYINLVRPPRASTSEKLPCLVNIHGFGGSPAMFDSICKDFLEKGIAVASIDYRLCPPNIWPSCGEDAKGCIRYLKAHAGELGLDPDRFAVLGGSMGGHLTAMVAACNGDPASEGEIGGNMAYDSSVKVAAAYFAFTDFFGFGEDSAHIWPHQPDKVAQCDGPYAPLGSMLGYVGPGKGMGELKTHLYDSSPEHQALLALAKDASPVAHVSRHSAPTALVHGIYDCGIQVPMGQSLRMFEALTRQGVKSLLLCNNNGIFGEDPEVRAAVVSFLCARI